MRKLPAPLQRLTRVLSSHPALSVILTVMSYSFFGPLAALVLVATMLDHEFGHRIMMKRMGYKPGPVVVIPLLGASVRAGTPMLRSRDIVLIYLAGPLVGVFSAAGSAWLANVFLNPSLAHQVDVGASVSIALNLFNLIPIEPLDGGFIARVLPYPALLLFPGALGLWLWSHDLGSLKIEALIVLPVMLIMIGKVKKWHDYVENLRTRADSGDRAAQRELSATLQIPLAERILVVSTYLVLVPAAMILLEVLGQTNGWLQV